MTGLTVTVPAEPERQDAVLRSAIAPLAREWRAAPELASLSFERLNKPDWRLLFRVEGRSEWIERVARARLAALEGAAFVDEREDDKWVGGGRETPHLRRIAHADTDAVLDWLDAEASHDLAPLRAEASVVLVERFLDVLGLDGERRLAFYRTGYQWEIDSGRWDAEVFSALDAMYRSQEESLRAIVAADGDLPLEEPARSLAERWTFAVAPPLEALREAAARGETERDAVTVASFVTRGHSNRMGIHATQEAVARYLVGRAWSEAPVR